MGLGLAIAKGVYIDCIQLEMFRGKPGRFLDSRANQQVEDMYKIIVLCFAGIIASTSAIVVQDYAVAEAAPSGLDWNYVYNYNGSSAVAVGGSWLLTAAHVADDGNGSVSADGTTYYPLETVYHTEADLALVRLDKAFPGFYPLYIGGLVDDPKLEVLLVGYGTMGTVRDFSWTDNGSGRGIKRWGSQEIDRTETFHYQVGSILRKSSGFWMDFNLVNTMYEAGVGEGDSGGGAFYNDEGVWKLAGINTIRQTTAGGYKRTFSISMPDYSDWVMATIPEPVAMSMLGLGMFGMFLARARRLKETVAANTFPFGRSYACDRFFTDRPPRRRIRFFLYEQGVLVQEFVKEYVEPVRNKAVEGYREWNKVFWDRMVTAHEQRMIRRLAIRIALRKKALDMLDTFLAHVMR